MHEYISIQYPCGDFQRGIHKSGSGKQPKNVGRGMVVWDQMDPYRKETDAEIGEENDTPGVGVDGLRGREVRGVRDEGQR